MITAWFGAFMPIGDQEMGTKIRDEAQAFVREGMPHKWLQWPHAKRLLIEHDDDEDPLPEEMEAFGYALDTHEDDGDDDGDPEGGDETKDDDDDPAGSEGLGDDDEDPEGMEAPGDVVEIPDDDDGVPEALVEFAPSVPDLVAAREVLIDHARQTGDTVTFRRLVKQRAGYEKDEKERSTAAASALNKRASELLAANEEHRKKGAR